MPLEGYFKSAEYPILCSPTSSSKYLTDKTKNLADTHVSRIEQKPKCKENLKNKQRIFLNSSVLATIIPSKSLVNRRQTYYLKSYLLFLFIYFLLISMFSSSSGAVLKGSCKKIGSRTVIDEAGCDLVAVYVNKCSGYCMSFSFPNPHQGNKLTVYAKCCRMTDVELIDVEINCSEGVRKVKVPSARECACFDCA